MEFIELLTKVWMESEKRERDKEEWARTTETRQWQQQDQQSKNMDSRSGEEVGATASRRPCPVPRSHSTGYPTQPHADHRTDTDIRVELSAVLRQMAESFGSLSTNDLNSQPGLQRTPNQETAAPSLPPKYCDYQNFPPPRSSSHTNLKQPVSLDANSHNDTPVKGNYGNECNNQGERMTSDEKAELTDIIKKLAEEQQSLTTRLRDHDQQLLTLLTRKPSERRKFSVKSTQLVQNGFAFPTDAITSKGRPPLNADMMDENTINAQIEHLYANLCRIHFPLQQKTVTQCLAMNETQIYSTTSSQEITMHQENTQLKEKIRSLENALRQKALTIQDGVQEIPNNSNNQNNNNNNQNNNNDNDNDNDIDSLKFPTQLEYVDCNSVLSSADTTDNNMIPSTLDVLTRDVQQTSSSFEWNISGYHKKMENEKFGKVTNTVSEPFHIGHCGYLARLEVYLNGNSTGYDRYMSVFLRIIEGDYDDLLLWPAKLSLTLVLVDQGDDSKESLMYHDDHAVFQYDKPSGDSFKGSNSWGLVEFVSHVAIQEKKFIKNDTIKLKIDITKCS